MPMPGDVRRERRGDPSHPPEARATMSRRRFLRIAAGGAIAVVAGSGVAQAYRFDIETITARMRGLEGDVRVAWLCDLHYGPFVRADSVAAWVDATLGLAPDAIVLGGDIVDTNAPDDLAPLLGELARLRAPLGTYAVWGNHEYGRFGQPRRFAAPLEATGVRVLADDGVLLRDDLYLAGVDSGHHERAANVRRALAGRPATSACLLASHRPDVLPSVPLDVDLTLCGHTHGGQVRIPGVGAVVTRTALGQAGTQGFVRAPALGYVSRGLGVVHVPLRLNCPAELTLATLVRA